MSIAQDIAECVRIKIIELHTERDQLRARVAELEEMIPPGDPKKWVTEAWHQAELHKARAEEREACARVCDYLASDFWQKLTAPTLQMSQQLRHLREKGHHTATICAERIRARENTDE